MLLQQARVLRLSSILRSTVFKDLLSVMTNKRSTESERLEALEAENQRLKAQLSSVGTRTDNPFRNNDAQLLSRVLEASSCAYIYWDSEKEEVHYSDTVWTMLGYKAGEYVNTPESTFALLLPEEQKRVRALFSKSIQSGVGYDTETQISDSSGIPRWIRIQTKIFSWEESGRAKHMVGAISSIDDLKTLQQATEAQSVRVKWLNRISSELFEKGNLSSIRWGLSEIAELLSGNRAYLRLVNKRTGNYDLVAEWADSELSSISVLLNDDEEVLMQKSIRRLLKSEGVYMSRTRDLELPIVKNIREKLGAKAQCGIPLFFRNQLQGCLVITSDEDVDWNTEDINLVGEFAHLISLVFYRQQMAAELSETQERFRYAMEATEDGLWDVNLIDGSIFVSRAYFGMLGYEEGELNEDWDDYYRLLHPDDFRRVKSSISNFFRNDEKNLLLEYRMVHKNGDAVWVLSRGRRIEYDKDGSARRVVGVHSNVTEFKLALARLDDARMAARSANVAKSEFLARMSHEIRTPMNAILGMSHLALGTELTSMQHDYLNHIDDAARSLLSIIDDILDFSKIEAGKLELEAQALDLSEFVSRLANLTAIKATQKDISLVFDVDPMLPLAVITDETRLSQVFINLISNAIKFTEKGGVCVQLSGDVNLNKTHVNIKVEVLDTGVGIAADSLQSLFDPFSQADGSVTRRFGGTGLGLTICKNLIEMMDGAITVSSEVGVGSRFVVELSLELQSKWRDLEASDGRLIDPESTVVLICADHLQVRAVNHFTKRYGGGFVTFENVEKYLLWLHEKDLSDTRLSYLLMDSRYVSVSEFSECKYASRRYSSDVTVGLVQQIHDASYSDVVSDEAWVHSLSYPLTLETFSTFVGREKKASTPQLGNDSTLDALRGMNVLLAEDNLVNQKVAEGLLKKKRVSVTVVNNGLEALEMINKHEVGFFDLILMDMEMPEMDGYQATKKIRGGGHHQSVPIVAMTAHAMKGDREKCLDAGMDEYLTKPIKPMDLYHLLLAFRNR